MFTQISSLSNGRRKLVVVPSVKYPILAAPGFKKKLLATWHLDLLGLCEYGCVYCSSNTGYPHRVNGKRNLRLAFEQLGERIGPNDDGALLYVWPDVIDKLRAQLDARRRPFGRGETCVYSMLTDGFSPVLLQSGFTDAALRLLVERTEFRIRILTKNPAVASPKWIKFFAAHRERFVVGLSIGTLDDEWAAKVERKVPPPSQRVRALHRLQDAGVATYGMLCPVFPHVLDGDHFERLVVAVRPEACETIWCEPYNDRVNWPLVQAALPRDSAERAWFDAAFGRRDNDAWSAYATALHRRLHVLAETGGWLDDKMKFLLYEDRIAAVDAPAFRDGRGYLLQSKPRPDGRSANAAFRAMQIARERA